MTWVNFYCSILQENIIIRKNSFTWWYQPRLRERKKYSFFYQRNLMKALGVKSRLNPRTTHNLCDHGISFELDNAQPLLFFLLHYKSWWIYIRQQHPILFDFKGRIKKKHAVDSVRQCMSIKRRKTTSEQSCKKAKRIWTAMKCHEETMNQMGLVKLKTSRRKRFVPAVRSPIRGKKRPR